MLVSAGKEEEGLKLLMEQEEKKPQWMCLKRYFAEVLYIMMSMFVSLVHEFVFTYPEDECQEAL